MNVIKFLGKTGYGPQAVSKNNPAPVYNASLNLVDKIDVNANGVTYYGSAPSGSATSAAVWQIQCKSVSGTVTTYPWADGDAEFDNIWDNRTSLSYS